MKQTNEEPVVTQARKPSIIQQEQIFKTSFSGLKRRHFIILAEREAKRREDRLTRSTGNRRVMLCRQVEAFWRRGRAYKHHLFTVKAPASPSVKQCTSLCLSDLSQFVWPPPCHANLMQLRNLAALLQGKTITRFVLRLASCSVLGTIHKSCSELQVV